MSVKVDYIVTYLIVTDNYKTSAAAAECAMHRKVLQATVTFLLNVIGVNVITATLKTAKFRCG